jgi:hypothetical protein
MGHCLMGDCLMGDCLMGDRLAGNRRLGNRRNGHRLVSEYQPGWQHPTQAMARPGDCARYFLRTYNTSE